MHIFSKCFEPVLVLPKTSSKDLKERNYVKTSSKFHLEGSPNGSKRNGQIYLSEDWAKTKTERVVTIPDSFAHLLNKPFLESYPESYFIFGSQFKLHPNKMCGRNEMNRRYRVIRSIILNTYLLSLSSEVSQNCYDYHYQNNRSNNIQC